MSRASLDKYYPSGVRNYARVVAVDNSQGAVDATLAQKLGVKSVYVLDDKESYGVGVADFFQKAATQLGIKVVGRDSWDPKAANYQALMQKIKAANPGAIFLGGLICSNGGQLIKDKVAVLGANSGVKLIAPDGFFISSTLTGAGSAGAAGQGMYVSNAGVPADKLVGAGKTFIDQFKAKYGVTTVQPYTAYAAQTAQVLLNAIAASDGTRASVTKHVFGMKITNGILGSFQIGSTGDIIGQQQFTIGVGNSKSGQFDTYQVVNPDPALVAKITGSRLSKRGSAAMASETHTARRPVLAVLPRITGLLNRAVTIALLIALLVFWLAVNFVYGPGQFGSVLLIGLTNGALYALVALGYTLVYGIIELINFAHGDVFMWGTMITVTIAGTHLGLDGSQSGIVTFLGVLGAMLGAMIFCGILNPTIERVALRRLRNAPRLAPLITTLGISYILSNAAQYFYGPNYTGVGAILPSNILFLDWPAKSLIVILATIPLLLGAHLRGAAHPPGQGHAGRGPGHGRRPHDGRQRRPHDLVHVRAGRHPGRCRRHPLRARDHDHPL